uniref:Asparagine synthetase [glutamine-hydrolyzing] n=1 Tax=Ditylenchus dipsaci TaxID=166011 RepID=A0A915DIU4_9BILA
MCGIWAILGSQYSPAEHNTGEFMKIAGRGPDLTVITQAAPHLWLGFHRLAIVEPGDVPSEQPIVADGLSVVCNGEIYNHTQLKHQAPLDNVVNDGSDCAAILHAFRLHNGDLRKCCAALDGVFAFVMADAHFCFVLAQKSSALSDCVIVSTTSTWMLCSNLFGESRERLSIQQYYTLPTTIERNISMLDAQDIIRKLLVDSVEKRLMGNRLFGFMLSGGLDSSLIASIASRFLHQTGMQPIAFSVGFEDSPDLDSAKRVADYLNIPHRVLVITPQQCIDAIADVVYALETFDPLLVRCGVAHFLLCKHIAATSDVKVLLSGEGADELFGSYAYMQCAPSQALLHREILRRLKHLHQYDVLRCDRCTSCHGLEIRVPFLDKKFIEVATRLPPSYKLMENKLEKHILRSAFTGWLPDEVLWRSKEGFSEALGKIDLEIQRSKLFPWNTPQNKEEFWYRAIFERCFELHKVDSLIHTKVYRTAAWHINAEPLSSAKDSTGADGEMLLSVMEDEETRFRRRSTGSTKFSGVA